MGLILQNQPSQIYLGGGAMPVPDNEKKYAADRMKVAAWREAARFGQQWRRDSAKAIEYWDGNQFDSQLAQQFRKRGLPMIAHNCIKRWINSVVGMMERNQTDGIVRIEDNRFEALGTALSQKLKESERMTMADRACLDAADFAFKGGIGWVEVGENSDPFQYKDRVEVMPWREMQWDMSAKKADLSDSTWFSRTRKYKRDALMAAFPQFAGMIALAGTDNDIVSWFEPERLEREEYSRRDVSRWSTFTSAADEVTVSEFRYRVYVSGYVVQTPGGPVIFDETNEAHLQAYYSGQVQPEACIYQRVRQAYWLGPHCMVDRWSVVPNNEVGWVSTICYIEDQTGVPYGLIRDMISLQDEINATKGKMHWSMDSTTIIGDADRVLDWEDAREAVNRRDGVILLNPRARDGRFELDRHQGITQWQFQAYQDAVSKIGYVHGLDAPIAGSTSSSGQSGKSQQIQIDQSVTCVGKPMAHCREARRKVLDLLLNQQIARMKNPEELSYKGHDGTKQSISINVPVQLADGSEMNLTLSAIKRQVVLDETPSTPTYRSQQFLQIVDTLRSMPEQAQNLLIPAMFEMSDLPNKQVYADMARKMLGLGGDKTPEEQQADKDQAEMKQRADAAAVALQEVQVELGKAKTSEANARADKTSSDAQMAVAAMQEMMQKLPAMLSEIVAKTQKTVAETQAIEQDMAAQAAALMANPTPDKTAVQYRW